MDCEYLGLVLLELDLVTGNECDFPRHIEESISIFIKILVVVAKFALFIRNIQCGNLHSILQLFKNLE